MDTNNMTLGAKLIQTPKKHNQDEKDSDQGQVNPTHLFPSDMNFN